VGMTIGTVFGRQAGQSAAAAALAATTKAGRGATGREAARAAA
jgi:hypothetical protein